MNESTAAVEIASDVADATASPAADAAPRFVKIGANGERLAPDALEWAAVLDDRAGLIWSANDVTKKDVPHKKAEQAVAKLELAGFADWRLPTVEELFLLADRTRRQPAIDTAFFPTCRSDWYWTSTPWAGSPADVAWIVGFFYGGAGGYHRDYDGFVRAVRSVSRAPAGQ